MNILFLGDIVGRPGREAAAKVLSKLRHKFKADIVIANGENLAHGKGVTLSAIEELRGAGVDFFTSGNHVWKKEGREILQNKAVPLIRPANYPPGVIGRGFEIVPVMTQKVAIVNLIGRTFFRAHYDCPFRTADEIIEKLAAQKPNAILIDFHCEATSEMRALGFHLDGRVTALLGTHTHVQTSDEQVLPQKTAYITNAGMCGVRHSVLGKNKDLVINEFLKQDSVNSDWDSDWDECLVEGVAIESSRDGRAEKIIRFSEVVKNS